MDADEELVLKNKLQAHLKDAMETMEAIKKHNPRNQKAMSVTLSLFVRGYATACTDVVPSWKVRKWVDEVREGGGDTNG